MSDRPELARKIGSRQCFTARLDRLGTRTAYRGGSIVTLLLRDVRDSDGLLVTDHVWFDAGKWAAGLYVGCVFSFEARVGVYFKGCFKDIVSHKLKYPTNVSVVKEVPHS